MASTALVVLTTLATEAQARALVTALLADRLVACGTLAPGARSLYPRGGRVSEGGRVGGGPQPPGAEGGGGAGARGRARAPPAGARGARGAAPPAARTDGPGTTLGLDDALTADPNNVALLVERAGRLAAARQSAAAQRDYERALALEPTHGAALTGLGVLLSRRGLWTQALPRLRRAADVEPGPAAAWYQPGGALHRCDDLAGAQVAYERAVELEPRSPKALYVLGIVLDRLRRPDEDDAE